MNTVFEVFFWVLTVQMLLGLENRQLLYVWFLHFFRERERERERFVRDEWRIVRVVALEPTKLESQWCKM